MSRQKIVDAAKNRLLVSDGAWGTFLQKKGLKPGECPERWCLDRPDDVFDIARSYIEAGADMIETNSFGGTRFKLDHFGLGGRVGEINEAAAAISRRAAGSDRHVIASIGPTGKILITDDEVTEDDLLRAFREQALGLARGGADAVCIETMSALDEAVQAIRAVKENTSLEIICTFTFEKTLDGRYKSMMGVTPVDAARAALDAGAHIIGANCGNGLERMVDIVKEMKTVSGSAPILVHANAGLPRVEKGQTVFPDSPDDMARLVEAVSRAGASIIGGCCGTSPDHIRAMKKAVEAMGR